MHSVAFPGLLAWLLLALLCLLRLIVCLFPRSSVYCLAWAGALAHLSSGAAKMGSGVHGSPLSACLRRSRAARGFVCQRRCRIRPTVLCARPTPWLSFYRRCTSRIRLGDPYCATVVAGLIDCTFVPGDLKWRVTPCSAGRLRGGIDSGAVP